MVSDILFFLVILARVMKSLCCVFADVHSNRKLLAQLLSKKGVNVQLCEDGLSALEKVSSLPLNTFHVIFMDNTMPNMVGHLTCSYNRRL
jgi:CheY-like chemotaxis protein